MFMPISSHVQIRAQGGPRPIHAHWAFAVAGYLAAGLLVLAPLLPRFGDAIPGGPVAAVDGWQNVWNLWWTSRALAAGRNPFYTDLLFFPEGAPLYLQTLGITNGLLALPATALWGPVAGYNLALLLSLVLGGLGAYALALHVGAGPRAAFVAGLFFTCSPYHLTRIYDGQLELAAVQWLPFFTLFLLRAIRGGQRRDALLAGLLLAAIGYTSWYYLLFMAIISAAIVLLSATRRAPLAGGALSAARRWSQAALTALVAAALLLPALLPAFAGRGDVVAERAEETAARSANLLDVLLPSYLHPIWGDALFTAVGRAWHDYSGDWNAALGYAPLALAAIAAWRAPRAAAPWLAMLALSLLFALGPELQVGPWRSGLPLPYALLDALPGLSLGRRPALFVAVATVALVPLTVLGLAALSQLPRQRRWVPALAVGVLAFELLPRPYPLLSAEVPAVYAELAGRPGALLEVPPPRYKYSLPQLAQTIHGRPLLGGYLARSPRYPWPGEAPGLRSLWGMRPVAGAPFIAGSAGPLAAMRAYGVGDVVVRWDQIAPERHAEVEAALAQALPGLPPAYADGAISVFQVPNGPLAPVAGLAGAGWGRPEGDEGRSWRWMGERGEIVLVNPGRQPVIAELSLRVQSYGGPRDLRLALDGADLGAQPLGAAEQALRLRLPLPPGLHRLALLADPVRENGDPDARLLSLALLDAQLATRPLGR